MDSAEWVTVFDGSPALRLELMVPWSRFVLVVCLVSAFDLGVSPEVVFLLGLFPRLLVSFLAAFLVWDSRLLS